MAAAEAKTAGEIVPVILSTADSYEVAYWKAAAIGGLVAELAGSLWPESGWSAGSWLQSLPWLLLLGLAGAIVSAIAVLLIPRLRPWLAGREEVAERTVQRAREAFLFHQLFQTRERTGILICVFQLERRVEVLADSGIHRLAPAGTWESLAGETARGMREEGSGAALLRAVRRCGEILEEQGLPHRVDDLNELGDEVRGDFR